MPVHAAELRLRAFATNHANWVGVVEAGDDDEAESYPARVVGYEALGANSENIIVEFTGMTPSDAWDYRAACDTLVTERTSDKSPLYYVVIKQLLQLRPPETST